MSVVFDRERIGYFDAPGQEEPAFDPGLKVNCPGCETTLENRSIRIILLMDLDGFKLYFYRVHQECDSDLLESLVEEGILRELVGL